MRINITNRDKIEEALDLANGKATTRTVEFDELDLIAEQIENSLLDKGLCKTLWTGLKFSVQPKIEHVAKAYWRSGTPMITEIVLERGVNSWFLADAGRKIMRTRKTMMLGKYSEEQVKAILDNSVKF